LPSEQPKYQAELDIEKGVAPTTTIPSYGTIDGKGEQILLSRKQSQSPEGWPYGAIFKSLLASLLVVGAFTLCAVFVVVWI